MPTITLRCPDCGHVTEWSGSIEAMKQLRVVCACGATKKRVWSVPALARGRATEGNGTT